MRDRLLEGREQRSGRAGGVGGAGALRIGELEWLELGGRRFEAIEASFALGDVGVHAESHVLGSLGSGLLADFRVVFDYTHRRIALLAHED